MDKRIIESYKELKEDIELIETRIEGLEVDKKILQRKLGKGPSDVSSISYDGMPKGSPEHRDIIYWIEEISRIESAILIDNSILENKKKTLKKMNDKINSFKGLENKIIYLREVEGRSLKDIADILGYSHDHIRRLHSKIKKCHI